MEINPHRPLPPEIIPAIVSLDAARGNKKKKKNPAREAGEIIYETGEPAQLTAHEVVFPLTPPAEQSPTDEAVHQMPVLKKWKRDETAGAPKQIVEITAEPAIETGLSEYLAQRLGDVYTFLNQEHLEVGEQFTPETLIKIAGFNEDLDMAKICQSLPLELARVNRMLGSYGGLGHEAADTVDLSKTYFNQTLLALEAAYQKKAARDETDPETKGLLASIDRFVGRLSEKTQHAVDNSTIVRAIDGYITSLQNVLTFKKSRPDQRPKNGRPHNQQRERDPLIKQALEQKEALELLSVLLEPHLEYSADELNAKPDNHKDDSKIYSEYELPSF